MRRLLTLLLTLLLAGPLAAQDLGTVLDTHRAEIAQPSRQTIGPVIEAVAKAGGAEVLAAWADRRLGVADDGRLAIVHEGGAEDALTGAPIAGTVKTLRPNSGVRSLIAAALVPAQLGDPDPATRAAALDAIARAPDAGQLVALRDAPADPDPALAVRRDRLQRLLAIRFDPAPRPGPPPSTASVPIPAPISRPR